ncbi:DUF6732 family protein [Falsihalocynthiibacter arcticus]|uniref:Uncharacterized protein n=1 Tax=Falsihalocynthiibacter arcticus TaxID=1579316 RepID=A0A126V034_9RHOB|nr:DUF6732 family protein [Falsihalocynthiibacter arcticus]AML51236.1 hypothetical protein RC74_08200 [Falsihalocynthiibacter arcticus]
MTSRTSIVSLSAVLVVTGLPVMAHPGHLIEAAGHTHWGAAIALGGAIAIGLWVAKGRKKPEAEEAEAEAEEEISEAEPQEA